MYFSAFGRGLAILPILIFFASIANAQTVYQGPPAGDWYAAANWSAGLPAVGNNALIPGGGSVVITSAITINYKVDNFGTLRIAADVDNQGTISNLGMLTVAPGVTIENSGNFVNQFGATANFEVGSTLQAAGFPANNGTMNVGGLLSINSNFTNSGTLNVDGTTQVSSNAQLNNPGTILNRAALIINGTLTNSANLFNEGSIENNGLFNQNNRFENRAGATFRNLPESTLSAGYGNYILNWGTFANKGDLTTFGTTQNDGQYINQGILNLPSGSQFLNAGTVSNEGTLSSNNTVENGGNFENSGTLNINSGCVFTNTGKLQNDITGKVSVAFELHNQNTGEITNNGFFNVLVRAKSTGQITNNAYFEINGDVIFENGHSFTNTEMVVLAAGNLHNKGTLTNQKSFLIDNCSSVNNTGNIENTGQISLSGIAFHTGSFAGNMVEINGGYLHTAESSNAPALCSDQSFGADINGDVKVYAQELIAFSNFDSCANMIYFANQTERPVFSCADIGTPQHLSVKLQTRMGDSLTCTAIATPVDVLEPQIHNCPGDITIYSAEELTAAMWEVPTATDNCTESVALVSDFEPGALFPVGVSGVSYEATDNAGNRALCQFRVSVIKTAASADCTDDHQGPDLNCPDDIAITTAASAAPAVWAVPLPVDNCLPVRLRANARPGTYFPEGISQVTYDAVDGNGNESSCTFTVTVTTAQPCAGEDLQPPVFITCPGNIFKIKNTTLNGAVAFWTKPQAADNCSMQSVDRNFYPGSIFPQGSTLVTYTAKDGSGHQASCQFTVTVADESPCAGDEQAPLFKNCPADVEIITSEASATATWTAPAAEDNCSPVSVHSNYAPGTHFPKGVTAVRYQASDGVGNVSDCTFHVSVFSPCTVDTTQPVINNCPADIIVASEGSGRPVNWTQPVATDNCTLLSFGSSYLPGAYFANGVTTVVYTAEDTHGNKAACSFNISVVEPPACTQNSSPVDGSTEVAPQAVTLTWNESTTAEAYQVFLGTANPPLSITGEAVEGTSLEVNGLTPGTTYYWYVVPKNVAGAARECTPQVTAFTTSGTAPSQCEKIQESLLVMYDFKNEDGNIIRDKSGFGQPLNLSIKNPDRVRWLENNCGIEITGNTIFKSEQPAAKIADAVAATNQLTLEAWIKPANTTQDGPARIFTFSSNTSRRNFTLGQDDEDYIARLRTTSGGNRNGLPTVHSRGDVVNPDKIQHLIFTRAADGKEYIFVDGIEVYSGTRSGKLANFKAYWHFAIGNEMTQDRPWKGEIYYIAVYNKMFTPADVAIQYQAGPCCSATVDKICKGEQGDGWNRYTWYHIAGDDLRFLRDDPDFPDAPDSEDRITTSAPPWNTGDNYGSLVTGFITPEVTGNYQFNITGDDQTELYLSLDGLSANKEKIAFINGWTRKHERHKYASQTSGEFYLEAGEDYYLEILHKEGRGADGWSVFWKTPEANGFEAIPGQLLSPYIKDCTPGTAPAPGSCPLTKGAVVREIWENFNKWNLDAINDFETPSRTQTLHQLALLNQENGRNYTERIRGFIIPPESGEYTFNETGDDYTEFWLSSDASPDNKSKIAYHYSWTRQTEFNKFHSQTSEPIYLQGGQPYYFEIKHLEGWGGDHFRISWKKPGNNDWEIIGGADIAAWEGCVPGESSERPNCNNTVLFVIDDKNQANGSDRAVKSRLESLGFQVELQSDDHVQSSDAAGKGLIVISSTVSSGRVNSTFKNTPVPLICYEAWLFDDLGMTDDDANEDFGTKGRRKLNFENEHDITSGFSAQERVYDEWSTMTWGQPSQEAIVLAHIDRHPDKKAVFLYEENARMEEGRAPARRVGFFLHNHTATHLTEKGWLLFDRTVVWAAGCQPAVTERAALAFAAYPFGEDVRLEWISNTGHLNQTFVVEHSADGQNFTAIQQLDGRGPAHTPTVFNSFDTDPNTGQNFYRIRLIYRDGSQIVTPSQMVYFSRIDDYNLFPNPARDQVQIALPETDGTIAIQLVNQIGQPIFKTTLDNFTENRYTLDLRGVESGYYVVWIFPEGKKPINRKLIVNKPW